jgi:hypothetical protein
MGDGVNYAHNLMNRGLNKPLIAFTSQKVHDPKIKVITPCDYPGLVRELSDIA